MRRKAWAEQTKAPVTSSEWMELFSMVFSLSSSSFRYASFLPQERMSRTVSSPSWMQSDTARLVRIFVVPKLSCSFLEPAVRSTATGTTHSTASAIRQSHRSMHPPMKRVEKTEAKSCGI